MCIALLPSSSIVKFQNEVGDYKTIEWTRYMYFKIICTPNRYSLKYILHVPAVPALSQLGSCLRAPHQSYLPSNVQVNTTKHCRFYREQLSPTPPKAGPGQTICCKFVSYLQEVGNFLWRTTVFSTNKTEHHNITGILLKVALNTYMAYNSQKSLFVQRLIKSCILFCLRGMIFSGVLIFSNYKNKNTGL